MTDVVDKKTRSRMMSGIRGKNTKPEILIRSLLHQRGYRFRLHVRNLSGQPDIVLKKYRAAIFIHGCFWHRHECHLFKWPKTRPEFWKNKINRNHENDSRALFDLKASGWRVCIIWECSIKGANKDMKKIIMRLESWLNGQNDFMEIKG